MNNTYIKGRITKGEFVSELFKQRIESIGGTYEANDCLVNSLNSLTDKEFKDAKAILTPNGYLVDKLPTIKPNGGGDATVTRNVTKTRVNEQGVIEEMAANVLAPDYLNGVCPALNVEGQSTNFFQNSIFEGLTETASIKYEQSKFIDGKKIKFLINSDRVFDTRPITLNTGVVYTFICEIEVLNGNILQPSNIFSYTFSSSNTFYLDGNVVASNTPLSAGNYLFKGETTVSSNSSGDIRFGGGTGFTPAGTESITFDLPQIIENYVEESSYIPTPTGQASTRSADTVTVPIPSGTTEIIEKYEDGTTNTITTVPASPYTVPTGKRYEYILMR